MDLTLALAEKLGSFSLLILLGFLAVRSGLMSYESSRALSRFGLYILTPCAMLDAFQYEFEAAKLQGMGLSMLACLIAAAVFALLTGLGKRLFHLNTIERLSLEYPNAGNLMIPLVAGSMGSEWVIYLCPCFFLFNLFMFTHGQSAMQGKRGFHLDMLLKNAVVLAMFLGLLFFLLDWQLPGLLGETVHSLADMMGPTFMFTVGMILGHANLRQVFAQRRAWGICAGRLLLYPAVTMLVLRLCPLQDLHPQATQILAIVCLAAGAPVAVTVTQFAQMYREEGEAIQASALNILSTVLCLATMPGVAWLYQRLFS